MFEYYNQFASYYDVLYGDKSEDIRFYQILAGGVKRTLEIACGTGRILIPLAKAGNNVIGIDYSENMLKVCRSKIFKEKIKPCPTLILADMRTFKLNHQFPLIIIPFRSFLHNHSQKDQITTLYNLKDHLLPNGNLIVTMFNPNVENLHKWNEKTFHIVDFNVQDDNPQEDITVSQKIKYDTLNQIFYWKYILQTHNMKGKDITINTYEGKCRYIWKNEFEILLQLVGFRNWNVFGGFNYEKLSSTSKEMVWIIQK